MHRNGRQKGFTLVELLMVIVIIALLAGLLVPTTTLIRDAARSTVCRNNLRQVGIGILAYAMGHEGELPPPTFTKTPWLWSVAVGEELELPDVDRSKWYSKGLRPPASALGPLACPAATDTGPTASLYIFNSGTWGDFGLNSWATYNKAAQRTRNLGQLRRQSFLILAGDCWGREIQPGFAVTRYALGTVVARHRGRANMVFIDGHVDGLRPLDAPLDFNLPPWKSP